MDTETPIEPSLRLEQGFGQGSQIGVFYDPMIAKLVVHGRDRTEALRMLRRGLEEYKVVGVSTNVEFLRTLAGNEAFISGDVETGFIPVSDLSISRKVSIVLRLLATPETSQGLVPSDLTSLPRNPCPSGIICRPP